MKRTDSQTMTEFILCIFTGALGGHHFYRGRVKKGVLYLFTCGLFGFGWLIDVVSLGTKIFQTNHKQTEFDDRALSERKRRIINSLDYGLVVALKRDAKERIEHNNYLVQVTAHGDSCEKCKRWENKVLIDDLFSNGKPDGKHQLLSYAIKQGLFHNGCSHGMSTYFPELQNKRVIIIDDDTGEVLEEIN